MPRGYRCVVFAVVGWLALCGAKPPAEQPESGNNAQYATPKPQTLATPTPAPATSPSPDFAAYRGYDPDPCYHAKDHDAADLCAQWRASIAAEKAAHEARRATTWSIVATLLNVISLLLVAFALFVTIQANTIARKIGQAQTRAYLSIKSLGGKKTPTGLVFRVVVQNSGQSPALAAQVVLDIIGKDDGEIQILPDIEHYIPAQSESELAFCYLQDEVATAWESIVVLVRIAYSDVFYDMHKNAERFAGLPIKWGGKNFTDLAQGIHIASYLRATRGDSMGADDSTANDGDGQPAEG